MNIHKMREHVKKTIESREKVQMVIEQAVKSSSNATNLLVGKETLLQTHVCSPETTTEYMHIRDDDRSDYKEAKQETTQKRRETTIMSAENSKDLVSVNSGAVRDDNFTPLLFAAQGATVN